ncbi:MAG: AmiS/UreI family transporter [Desulfitobacteriaceae bacterium]
MSNVGLLYVGAVLFLNSILLLGRADGKSAGVFNLFVGLMQTIGPLYLIFTAHGDQWLIFSASGLFLFGFTYLFVGITNLAGLDSTGVGWYSLWVAILALGYSFVTFVHFGDAKFGVIWLMWSFLWTLFFILLGLKREIAIFTGWVTFFESWITAAIPAFLLLTGQWDKISTAVVVISSVFTVVVSLYLSMRSRPLSLPEPGNSAH